MPVVFPFGVWLEYSRCYQKDFLLLGHPFLSPLARTNGLFLSFLHLWVIPGWRLLQHCVQDLSLPTRKHNVMVSFVNLTGSRDAQVAGKTNFLSVSIRVFLGEISI